MVKKRAVAGNPVTGVFPLLKLNCASCAARAEKIINGLEGVENASVNFAAANVIVNYYPDIISAGNIRLAVIDAGYDMITDGEREAEKEFRKEYSVLKKRTLFALFFSVPVVITGMFFMDMPYAGFIMWILSTPVIFLSGRGFFLNAWRQLKRLDPGMDTLVALSTSIAYFFSVFNSLFPGFWLQRGIEPHVYYEAAAVIIAFILLGRLLEAKAKTKTSEALKKLIGLQPGSVTVIEKAGDKYGEKEIVRDIPVEQVGIGDTLLVKPGERIAADGTVTEGESYVDESMLSGEPVPVFKIKGGKVFSGTINHNGSFRFIAEKVGGDTMLSRIIELVRQAQGSKAPVQRLVDRIAGIFVPVVVLIALLSAVMWFILGGKEGITYGLLSMVTVLIIACPCALGLATPTAIMVGIGRGAQKGILIKDAVSLEIATKINAVVLDKTGTVTEGKPVVTDMFINGNISGKEIERLFPSVIYSLEKQSSHPLAEAVCNFFDTGQGVLRVTGFRNIAGKGAEGYVEGRKYFIGSLKLMIDNDIEPDKEMLEKGGMLEKEARTVIWFAGGKEVIALLAVADKIKENSVQAVDIMQKAGIEVYMLTGDNENTAGHIARIAGIKHFRASVLPEEKAAFVAELQRKGKVVAMAGDGINDSAALACADISIAMGKGSDIAMDAAQMTIISSDLMKIPQAVKLSSLTVKTIRMNLFWAFIYNITGIPLAAGVLYPFNGFLLDPMIAGAAMALSSVSVVLNSLLLGYKARKI